MVVVKVSVAVAMDVKLVGYVRRKLCAELDQPESELLVLPSMTGWLATVIVTVLVAVESELKTPMGERKSSLRVAQSLDT